MRSQFIFGGWVRAKRTSGVLRSHCGNAVTTNGVGSDGSVTRRSGGNHDIQELVVQGNGADGGGTRGSWCLGRTGEETKLASGTIPLLLVVMCYYRSNFGSRSFSCFFSVVCLRCNACALSAPV